VCSPPFYAKTETKIFNYLKMAFSYYICMERRRCDLSNVPLPFAVYDLGVVLPQAGTIQWMNCTTLPPRRPSLPPRKHFWSN
jgi:hypothetical protein